MECAVIMQTHSVSFRLLNFVTQQSHVFKSYALSMMSATNKRLLNTVRGLRSERIHQLSSHCWVHCSLSWDNIASTTESLKKTLRNPFLGLKNGMELSKETIPTKPPMFAVKQSRLSFIHILRYLTQGWAQSWSVPSNGSFWQSRSQGNAFHWPYIFDELKNRREEDDRLYQSTSKPTNIQVAKAYFRSHTDCCTTTLFASVAVRVLLQTLSTLGSIVNGAHTDFCLQSTYIDTNGGQIVKQVLNFMDFWVNCNMLQDSLRMRSMHWRRGRSSSGI